MAANKKNRPSNYVIFTLQAIADADMRFSQAGRPWASVRAFLSQGKDKQTDEYKPSVFFDVKAFSEGEEASPAVVALSEVSNKDRFTVKGRLAMREWTGENGGNRQVLEVHALNIESFSFDGDGPAAVDEPAEEYEVLEGEPA